MKKTNKPTTVSVELLRKYDRPGPRYTSYPTVPEWHDGIGNGHYIRSLKKAVERTEEPFAVYCHIPFCRKRCFYCGCNTCVINDISRTDQYLDRLEKEIDEVSSYMEKRRLISQFHFGGGTPTYLDIERLGKILDKFESVFQFTDKCEKSIELDPRVTTKEQLDFLAGRGFNRISLGVQDFDPDVQEAIGRIQPIETVEDILNYGRKLGFGGINFDLIYGLPKQSVESFRKTLKQTVSLAPDRLAIYSFAYLPELKLHQKKINPDDLPDTETKYSLFAGAIEILTAAGYNQIGMDHFARPEDELSIAQNDGRLHRNFMGYTVQSAHDMIGFGMSSIGYVEHTFVQNLSKLHEYEEAVEENGMAVFRGMELSYDDLIRQFVINSLMCNFRLEFDKLYDKFSVNYHEYFKEEHSKLQDFVDDKFLVIEDDAIRVTEIGRTFVRNIAMTFDIYFQRQQEEKKATFSRTI